MAVKYHCPKCEKRFIDWGAEKLKFKCPDCEDEKLIEVSHSAALVKARAKKPAPKRKKKKTVVTRRPVAVEEPLTAKAADGQVDELAGSEIANIEELDSTSASGEDDPSAAAVEADAISDIKSSEASANEASPPDAT